jgi:hypothetical protein
MSKCPCWTSHTLTYCIYQKSAPFIVIKTKSDVHYTPSSCFRELVKVTIKSDRQRCLKSVDDSLKSQPKQFWKYVSNFERKDNTFIHIKVDD